MSPGGRVFEEETEATNRILNEGIPFIIVDVKEKVLSIKENDCFLLTNPEGNIPWGNGRGLGFYYQDTRFLSCLEFSINGKNPVCLTSTVELNYLESLECTNPDLESDGVKISQQTLNIRQLRLVKKGLHNKIRVKNYNSFTVNLNLQFKFDSDFADIFEVRGLKRKSRGKLLRPQFEGKNVILAYIGKDDVFRQTKIHFAIKPSSVEIGAKGAVVVFNLKIKSFSKLSFGFYVEPIVGEDTEKKIKPNFGHTLSNLKSSYKKYSEECLQINTDNQIFNRLLARSRNDVRSLVIKMPEGRIIAGGIPWFMAPFGRDSIITSIQTLPLCSDFARDTIKFLAAFQGKKKDNWRDEEPGKIIHELRRGELANLNEIPHTPYYGSVDSTPLFLILISEYLKWTNDIDLIKKTKINIDNAVNWIKNYGDKDGDLFVEYERKSEKGLDNQGWKDSFDSVFHIDGKIAKPPIVLAEVQAYVYYALRRMSQVYDKLGEPQKSMSLVSWAEALKKKFNKEFWMEEANYLAMALDADKRQVKTITSNPGQVLWTGILDENKAKKVAERLMRPDMFSGWGVRTVSKLAKGYNPMSYHNGTVWPHDNALITRGLKRYGFDWATEEIVTGLYDVATHHAYMRLPELFCGFTREEGSWPIDYPVACSPQAWSAGSIFMILQSLLGISSDAPNDVLYINNPILPNWLKTVELKGLRVGKNVLDISFRCENNTTSFTVPRKEGKIKIIMEE
ncbi:amylo-alpha-1,6-glucosidase [Candidatus Oleimmundimicrobium sp.]|uniref:amylo-alpha-1,6-glucosidase n=1 Tax=Candidatus Oleimmundimicrobium sp. TaxID=3060597 RepID=UPI00272462EE|nr:amylo-alpha-1,6-glucosidase [Candidatus Oleimmundimicrobium sp.]MDO8886097.1 amylo-alpha-1,6-glucosidase [Candidatus Oleimmundimicrobium sp.]